MKKNFKMIFAAAAAFAMVLSCSKEENPLQGTQGAGSADSLTPITISATLTDNMTKVSFTPSYDGGKPQSLSLAWEAEDKLRVYNHDDRTQFADFEIAEESIGQKTGIFTGDIFNATSYDVEVINGEVGYAEQTQPADGETASLKYLASATGVTDLKAVIFTESSSVLAITALMPEGGAAGVTSVELSASEAIFSTGKTLTINLAEKGDAGNDGILHLFANLPVGNQQIAEGTTLLVRFNAPDTDHTVYTRYIELGAQTFEAGKLNTINVNASQSDKHAGLVSCDGSTAENAYLIGDKYQLQAMSSLMNADATTHFAMVADVDLDGAAWTSASGKVAFEGNNHKISNVVAANGLFTSLDGSVQNLVIDAATITPTAHNAGVLADVTVSGASIRNITITNSSISGKDYVGGLVGILDGNVENVDIACPVNGGSKVGGLVGQMKGGTLKNVSVTGILTCTYQTAGGLVALMDKGTIENCSFTADLNYTKEASYANVGGLIGEISEGNISGSYTKSNVTAVRGDSIGGLIGVMKKGTVENCYATGSVTVTGDRAQHVGGLIGQVSENVTVDYCYATGAVSAVGSNVGGLIGRLPNGGVKNSYATGNVAAKNSCSGGLVGYVGGGKIENSYATGNVTTEGENSGGLVGQAQNTSIEKCYAEGTVSSTAYYSGGLIGFVENSSINKSYATGAVATTNHYAGGIAAVSKGTVQITQSYATVNIDSNLNRKGGLVGEVWNSCTIANCYVDGTMTGGGSYNGGFLGTIVKDAVVAITNSYTKSSVVGGTWNSGVFCGEIQETGAYTCSGFIGWNTSGRAIWVRLADGSCPSEAPDGNYMGTTGTIKDLASGYGWDTTIWDLSGNEPKLKWTLANN